MPRDHYDVDTFTSQRSVGYLVKRLYRLMTPQVEATFANEELTFSHWVALIGLRDGLTTTAADIARHLGHDSGATTRLVDQLEKRGYLTRERSREDRRVIRLKLTPAGRAVVRSLAPRVVDFLNDALADFTPEEFVTLLDLLTRLLARFERTPETDATEPLPLARRRSARR